MWGPITIIFQGNIYSYTKQYTTILPSNPSELSFYTPVAPRLCHYGDELNSSPISDENNRTCDAV